MTLGALSLYKQSSAVTTVSRFRGIISGKMSVPVKSEPDVACKPKPEYATFSANASRSEIYDFYQEHLRQKEKGSRKEEEEEEETQCTSEEDSSDEEDSSREKKLDLSLDAVKLMERLVVYNIYWQITDDFLYFEDASDEFRGEKGTLLPLWEFQYEEAKGLSVTSLCWCTEFSDLFAVGLGSYGYDLEDRGGMLLFYTRKMHTYPEFIFKTDLSVMCIDIHKERSELVAVGMKNGWAAVYSLLEESKQPICKTTCKIPGERTGHVMQVKWRNDDFDGNLNFLSVSTDGRVVSWTLRGVQEDRHELDFTDIIELPARDKVPDNPGISLDIHKEYNWIYLVASQSGTIYKGDTYSVQKAYDAHSPLSLQCVRWNPFHSEIFISCDLNWMVKVWDASMKSPMLTFDLRDQVDDVAWAPYSSTVFAAVTADGKVHVFDLSVNKYEALCQQKVVPRKKGPLKIAFNPVDPIIIVGENCGRVISLKPSPNLRKKPKDKKGQELPNGPEDEKAKLEQLLRSLR